MRLLLQKSYVGPWDDPCEFTHVTVEIDPRHQLDMRARLSDVLALPQLYSVTFFDWAPQPVSCDFCDEVPEWFDDDAEVLVIPNSVSLPAADFRISAPTIRYMPDGIMWHFYEKYGGASYETATVLWDSICTNQKPGANYATNQISNSNRPRHR